MIVLGVVLALAAGVGASVAAEPTTREEVRYVMGTVAEVRITAPDPARADAALAAVWSAFARTDSLMSTWRPDSDLSRVNAAGAERCVAVASELADLIETARDLAAASGGAFDPTLLPLMRAWGLRDGRARQPDESELASLRALTGPEMVAVDRAVPCVRLLQPGVELDLGGIGKGHALDVAKRAAQAAGATGGVFDLGGNLLVFGLAAGRDSVAIAAPDGSPDLVAVLAVHDAAVATSGQYERFVELDGEVFGHILDPRTGRPVARRGSVTVVAPTATLADGLATAAFVLGPEAGSALVARHPGARCVFVVEDADGGWSVLTDSAATSRSP